MYIFFFFPFGQKVFLIIQFSEILWIQTDMSLKTPLPVIEMNISGVLVSNSELVY